MGVEQTIDTLRLDIVVNSNNGAKTIKDTSKAVDKLSTSLHSADFSKLERLSKALETFNSATSGLGDNVKGLSGLNTRLRTLNTNLSKIDTNVFKSKFAEMTTAITPFIDKVNSAQASLSALQGVMGGAKTLTKANITPKATTPKSSGVGNKLDSALNIGSIVGKLYFVRNVTKQLGQSLAQVVQYGIDYQETLNLWQTAMRGNISQARVFVSEMNKAYGISSATLMNYQAVFKNMLAALGNISDATAYGLSESLTQMALDFASLYNTSVESAMTKFQAVLSGQVRPIRTAGYDITEQTLFQLYQSLGGTKTVRQLNQTEKQLLRILAVFEQMNRSGATGDLAKTLGSSANQLRMMKEQGKEFATWIGISFNTLLEKSRVLVGINTALYVATELARSLSFSLGYAEPDWGIDFAEGVKDAEKEVDNLKGKLLGFDKFQVLQSGGGEDGVDIEDNLVKALEQYQSLFKGVDNPAVSKATSILEALGGKLVDVKNEAGEVVGQIWKFPPALVEATKLLGAFAGALAIVGIVALEKKLISAIIALKGFNGAFNLLYIGGLALVIYGVATLITQWDELSTGAKILMIAITALGTAIITYNALQKLSALINSQAKSNLLLLELAYYKVRIAASLAATAGVAIFVGSLMNMIGAWDKMTGFEKVISIFGLIGSAALVAAAGIAAFQNAWSVGTASVAIIGGLLAIGGAIASYSAQMRDIEKHADGGLATKGSLFYAGEAGPELVTQTSGGGSTIMNMKQLEDAVARGFIRGFASTDNGYDDNDTTDVYVDGQRLFNIMRGTAKRNGYDFVRI